MQGDLSYSQKLAQYYVNSDAHAIPESAIAHAKNVIVDWAGCGIGGANVDSTKMVKSVFLSNPGQCTVFCGYKASVENAAFINGAASHALEMDDASYDAGGHPAVVILPAAMAVAEMLNASGKDFLLSVIWGYDMMTRVGRGLVPNNSFEQGWHPTAINGIFGATVAVAYLMGLDAGQMANAMGIAGGFASGNLECYADGSLTKRLNPANAAMGAVNAARLAKAGYTGPKWVFEGKHGFFRSYTDDPTPERMLENLDYSEYPVELAAFKPYACCRYNHAPIDSILGLMSDNGLKANDIEKIVVDTCHMAIRAVVEPREIKYNPPNEVGAQFSLPYTAACAALFADVSVVQFSDEKLADSQIREFSKKIDMIHTGEMDKYLPDIFAADVKIFANDGRTFSRMTKFSKGDPENPMSAVEIKEKFMSLCQMTIAADTASKVYDAIMQMDKLDSIRDLTKWF
ncbi:MAG: MmgE/PrpD family protein [Oscillospiraceae bacterium]|nr:MmgE/PrpD family protein [Oscillospiraceae bacterium]